MFMPTVATPSFPSFRPNSIGPSGPCLRHISPPSRLEASESPGEATARRHSQMQKKYHSILYDSKCKCMCYINYSILYIYVCICTYDACIIFPTYIIHIKCAHDCKHMLTLRKYGCPPQRLQRPCLPNEIHRGPIAVQGQKSKGDQCQAEHSTGHVWKWMDCGVGSFCSVFYWATFWAKGIRNMDVTFQPGLTTIYLTSTQVEGKPAHCLNIGEFIPYKKVHPTPPSYLIPAKHSTKTNRSNAKSGSCLRSDYLPFGRRDYMKIL